MRGALKNDTKQHKERAQEQKSSSLLDNVPDARSTARRTKYRLLSTTATLSKCQVSTNSANHQWTGSGLSTFLDGRRTSSLDRACRKQDARVRILQLNNHVFTDRGNLQAASPRWCAGPRVRPNSTQHHPSTSALPAWKILIQGAALSVPVASSRRLRRDLEHEDLVDCC